MPKKDFDPNKMKNSDENSNIESRMSIWYFDIQNRALKVIFDHKKLYIR